jgi:EamA domain-containing membrane protein RarD
MPCGQMLGMSELTDSRGTVDIRASLAIAGGAAMWGLFWIPLRYVSDAGLGPMWAAALTLCGGLPFAFMAVVLFARKDRKQWPWMVVFGLGMGMSATLYFVSVIMTDVVRAIFLFYMLPIWTTLFDRAVFGIRLDIARAFSVIIAFAGLWLLLGGDGGVPLPRNAGDWAALGAGFCWGITLSLVRSRPAVDPHMSVFSSVLFASTFSMLAALLITGGGPNVPEDQRRCHAGHHCLRCIGIVAINDRSVVGCPAGAGNQGCAADHDGDRGGDRLCSPANRNVAHLRIDHRRLGHRGCRCDRPVVLEQ